MISTYCWIQKDCGSEIMILKISKDSFERKRWTQWSIHWSKHEKKAQSGINICHCLKLLAVSETVYKSIEKKMSILAEWYFALNTSEKDKVHLFLNFSFKTISITRGKDIHAYHQEKIFDKENTFWLLFIAVN